MFKYLNRGGHGLNEVYIMYICVCVVCGILGKLMQVNRLRSLIGLTSNSYSIVALRLISSIRSQLH